MSRRRVALRKFQTKWRNTGRVPGAESPTTFQAPWARLLKLQEQEKAAACEALRETFTGLNSVEPRRRLDAKTLSEPGKAVAEKRKQGSPQKTPALV